MGWVKGSDRNFKASQTERCMGSYDDDDVYWSYEREKVGFIERERERRWVLLKIPRCDIDGLGEEQ